MVDAKVLNYIGGEFVAPLEGKWIENINPATGLLLSLLPDSQILDVDHAAQAAANAFPKWSQTPLLERAKWLRLIAEKIENRSQEFALAESQDQGKPVKLALEMDVARCVDNFQFFADFALSPRSAWTEEWQHPRGFVSRAERSPVGVVALITPWNLPLYLLTWKLAPALLCGNAVVCKPSEFTSTTAHLLAKVLAEIGFPPGVVNFVYGKGDAAGAPLVAHAKVHAVSFTGGTETGSKIAALTAPLFKKTSLELGGKNPSLVFADADLDKAVATHVRSAFLNQGEICLCTSRIYVQRSLFEEFCQKFTQAAENWKLGDPLDPHTQVGALASPQHLAKVHSLVEKAKQDGAKVLLGGQPAKLEGASAKGNFYPPTILVDVPRHSAAQEEEIFGPVVSITPFESTEQAIDLANDSRYGLCATVWTRDQAFAESVASQIQTGTVWINTWLARDLHVPFGGVKASGLGREGGNHSLDFFSEWKTIVGAQSTLKAEMPKSSGIFSPQAAEPVGPYPHARRWGDTLFLSGIGPREKGKKEIPGVVLSPSGEVTSYSIETQFHSCIKNVTEVLKSAGLGLEHIIDIQVYLTDIKTDFAKFNAAYKEYFNGSTGPTRTTIGVTGLPTPISIELKVTARCN